MQIDQIIVRPGEKVVLIQYSDNTGRSDQLVFESAAIASAAPLIAEAQQRLPSEQDRPDKSEIEQEIAELEYRLVQLKASIGEQ